MRYFGGKARVGKRIATYLNSIRKDGQPYWEPFVGSAGVLRHIKGKPNYASDVCLPLIQMWKQLQQGWIPPSVVTERMYNKAKSGGFALHITAFIGFGCSWGGKWFGGYARSSRDENFALQSKNSLLKKAIDVSPVEFFHADYSMCEPPGGHCLIYCDPPYRGTTGYDFCGDFDFGLFWDTVRGWEFGGHSVVISEYGAPRDFKCVLEIETKTEVRNKEGIREPRTERLFRYNATQ